MKTTILLLLPSLLFPRYGLRAAWEMASLQTGRHQEANADLQKHQEIYRKKAQAELDEMNKKIEELKRDAAKASARTRKKLDKEIAELEPKRRRAQRKLEQLKTSGAVAWADAKAGVRAAMDDLERAYRQAVHDLK